MRTQVLLGTSLLGAAFLVAPARASVPVSAALMCPATTAGVHRAAPGLGRTVALTFDDGPGVSTVQIVSILRANRVRATFFDLGVAAAAHPALVAQEVNSGSTVANHTWDHATLTTLSAAGQAAEMDRESAEQAQVSGRLPCLFRPPGGHYDATTLSLAQARRLSVWTWSVDPEDWRAAGSGSAYWVQRIIQGAEAGGALSHPVVLLHDSAAGAPATVTALPTIIAFYRARGYAFVDLAGRSSYPSASPFGSFDRLSRWPGGLRVDGWAVDPDLTAAASIDVYLDGAGQGRYRAAGLRLDVARAYPAYGAYHGYAVTFPYAAAGTRHVCTYAVDAAATGDVLLGCRTVTVSNNPFGHVDVVRAVPGGVSATGWTVDPDTAQPVTVTITVDGAAVTSVVALRSRPDVSAALPGWGSAHGFAVSVPARPGAHAVCVTALNVGPGGSARIGCATALVP